MLPFSYQQGVFPIISLLKKIFSYGPKKSKDRTDAPHASLHKKNLASSLPETITRKNHSISRTNISKHALHVLYKLHDAGYEAYLVGGSVRDLLLGGKPKDFDVATDALPEKVRQLFRNSRLIGRRFRLAHVFFGQEIIEVATFRASHPEEEHPDARKSATGLLVRDNVYGDLQQDAQRRDFSINALYYNIADFSVLDYAGGMEDLKKCKIRILGDPHVRYTEDPVRILRAIRFAAKLDFTLEQKTEKPIHTMKGLLRDVAPARLFEEILKLFYCGHAKRAFLLLSHYGLFEILFPQTHAVLYLTQDKQTAHKADYYLALIIQSCENTDKRLQENLSVNPAFLFAVLLWPAVQTKIDKHIQSGKKSYVAFEKSVNETVSQQLKTVAIPKRHTNVVREIWSLQRMMEKRAHRKIDWVLMHPRFRAAYDFLLLRLRAGDTSLEEIVEKLTQLQIHTPPHTRTAVRTTRTRKKRYSPK